MAYKKHIKKNMGFILQDKKDNLILKIDTISRYQLIAEAAQKIQGNNHVSN